MAAESGGSEAEEPPWFPFLGPRGRRQPAGTGTGIGTGEERGAVLISSSPPAPGWAELAGGLGGSEEEEEELVPLSERLRGRGGSEEEEEELVPLSERLRGRGGSEEEEEELVPLSERLRGRGGSEEEEEELVPLSERLRGRGGSEEEEEELVPLSERLRRRGGSEEEEEELVPLSERLRGRGGSEEELVPLSERLRRRGGSEEEEEELVPLSERLRGRGGSEEEEEELVPLSERLRRRGGSEEEEEELVPLSERLRRRGGSEEEEEELVPLSERLRRRGGSTLPPKPRSSEPRPPAPQARGPTHCQVTKLAPRGPGQSPPKATGARVTCWELSDSDQDDAPPDPQRAPWHQSPAQRSRSPGPYPSSQMSPPLKKSRHGQEEKERARQAALQQRREQKWQQEQERERRKALADRLKAQRPAECLKYITVVLDPALLQVEGGGQILSALQAMDCCCVIESQAVPCSITWRRRSGSSLVEESSWIEEPNILVLLRLENFLSMICNYRQEVHGGIGGPKETLRSFVASVREKAPRKTLALAVVELEKYFRSHKVQSRKKLRQAVLNGNQVEGPGKRKKRKEKEDRGPELSRMEVEEALVDLQLHTGVQLRILESWKELGDFASMFTKAVAEAPFKQERGKTSFSFYLESDWCGGVKVDRSGKGLSQVWKRQIQQFNRVSPEMANAIAAAYPSPLFLSRAYQSCLTEQERQNMLADIPVRRGDGVTATSRRVGPELSKRIYLQMTSYNPDLSLDVTG